ncbi:MAG: hypothetical protein ACREJ0_19400 [Geminicoccaceae bacterium]
MINQETGWPDPVHFRQDALKRGLSVNRRAYISEATLRAKIEAKILRDKEEGKRRDDFYKVVTTSCGNIRSLLGDDGRRAFCVYDTATGDDTSHADVCQALEPSPGTPNRQVLSRKISRKLFEVFMGQATELATVYRNGA